jgi:phage gpG-like protein
MLKARFSIPIDELLFSDAVTERKAKAVAEEAKKLIDKHFETRQSTWKKLSAVTIALRIAAGYGAGPILIQSRKLRETAAQNITVSTNSTGATIQIESGTTYSGLNEFGGKNADGKYVRARPFLKMEEKEGDFDKLFKIYFES